jgi:hypothetical protein
MSRRLLAAIASVAVIGVVIAIIALSLVPVPDYPAISPGRYEGSLAFVDDDNCAMVADLGAATITELRCEPEQGWIDQIAWTDEGIEITAYLNQPTTRVLDPDTGELLETRTGEDVISEPPLTGQGLPVDRVDERELVIYDEENRELLRLEASEQYWIEVAVPSSDGELIALADSLGRLAVFDRQTREPLLVDEDVRTWPYPVWAP